MNVNLAYYRANIILFYPLYLLLQLSYTEPVNHFETAEIDEHKHAINGSSKVNVDPGCFYNVPIDSSYHRTINYLKSSHFKSLSIDKVKTEMTQT